jgi:uncharacterized membrane protein YhaH (DUF805 family)
MSLKISDLWRWDGTIDRGPYLFWGIGLFAVKFNLDRLIGGACFGKPWTFLDPQLLRIYLWQSVETKGDELYFLTLLAASLPFLWAGTALTLRRLRSLGWSPWLVLLFFVPLLKLVFFALLCLMPSRVANQPTSSANEPRSGALGRWIPRSAVGSAIVAIVASTALTAAAVWLGTAVLNRYGWTLFVGVPFLMGFLSTVVHSYHEPRTLGRCLLVSLITIVVGGTALLLFAMEGALCLVMAAPIALVIGLAGGAIGYVVQKTFSWRENSPRLFCVAILAIPAVMGVERAVPPRLPLLEVKSSVIVDAPPEKVWQNVVSFTELPPPKEFIFKIGVAYPIRAEIHGHGVGAVRHCNFSTGPFVEPIETWDEPRLLKFAVTENPEPMQEWTPYHEVHPRHLDGYLESQAGQFRLVPLAGGRTLLEGTTWYSHHLWPAAYWQVWSDHIIHTIHLRVLNHVKELSEKEKS